MAELSSSVSKRQRTAYHHQHSIKHPLVQRSRSEPALLPQDLLDKLLVDALKTICEEQAYKQDISSPYIDSVALEAFRNATDAFARKLCSTVKRSMNAGRRNVPVATDIESAFLCLDIPQAYDQLKPYHVTQHKALQDHDSLLLTPPPDDEFHKRNLLPENLLGPELSRQQDLKQLSANPRALPPLPSAHTYRDSPVFGERETDIRKIREQATEEGKLGEKALRKLAGAVKLEAALATEPEFRYIPDRRKARLRRVRRDVHRLGPMLTVEATFEESMKEMLRHQETDVGFELGPIVSCEKKFRMPDEGRVKRRLVTQTEGSDLKPDLGGSLRDGMSKDYNVLPPPANPAKSHHQEFLQAMGDSSLEIEL